MKRVNEARQKKDEKTSSVQTKIYDVHTKKISKEKVIRLIIYILHLI